MAISSKVKARISLAIMLLCIAALVAAAVGILYFQDKGTNLAPSPTKKEQKKTDDGFPKVDWRHWKKINPDVIGWITIPGTNVDYPIVQAPADDPQFYLTHDVYRDWNYVGCPYLDASCSEDGLMNNLNAVVYGHNMGWNQEMFGDLEYFIDPDYAHSHSQIYLQTKKAKRIYSVQAVDIIPGWEAVNRTKFEDKADLFRWWEERYEAADVKLASGVSFSQNMVTLCTCSYNFWSTERTIVYCM